MFDAVLGEDYTLAGGAIAPRITVYIPETVGRFEPFRMGGGGTTDSPLEITTADQLAEIAELVNAGRLESFLLNGTGNVSLKLMNDLDLSAYGQGYNGGKGWKPIGTSDAPFYADFAGNGQTISGLYINDSTLDNAGLFGCVRDGTLKGLTLKDVDITAKENVGALFGSVHLADEAVSACFVSGTVSGEKNVGGIAGSMRGKMADCFSTAHVAGIVNNVGDIAGMIYGSFGDSVTVEYCYAIGEVSGDNCIGGLVGGSTGTIKNCATLNAKVIANSFSGRIVGAYSGPHPADNVAFIGMVGGGSDPAKDGADMTAAEIKADGTIGGRFTAANGWTVENGKLPGFGAAVDMPDYITGGSDHNFPGAGTAAEPFLIDTAEKLAKLAELVNVGDAGTPPISYNIKYYKLTADIDLSDYGASNTDFNGGKGWIPIGTTGKPFEGNFDGSGKTITGLYINDDDLSAAGLFGYVDGGTIEKLSVSGVVRGKNYVGGLVGYLIYGGTTQSCYSTVNVTSIAPSSSVGGLIGAMMNDSACISSYAAGSVSGNISGGIAGQSRGTIKNCAALNPHIGETGYIGRIVGAASNITFADNVAFDGMVCTPDGLSYYNGTDVTADALQTASGFPSALTTAPWTYEPGKLPGLFGKTEPMPAHITAKLTSYFAGGDGSQNDPYQITTAAQLAKLAELVGSEDEATRNAYNSKHYKLMNNLDLSGYGASNTGFNGGKGWVPIGTKTNKFLGHFDGNHKTITGLYINDEDLESAGLLGNIEGGSVKKLRLTGVNIVGFSSVGGIAGTIKNAVIEVCAVSGSIHGTASGGAYVGGVVGMIGANGKVENCYSTGGVSGNPGSGNIGGIAGCLASGTSSVQNCYSTAEVKGGSCVAGIAGATWSYDSVIKNCAALNPAILSENGANNGRVVGRDIVPYPGKLAGNRAFSGMIGGGSYKTADGTDGADMTAEQINTAEFWYTDAVAITLTGKGNFKGEKTGVTYIINKKTPAAADLTYDLTAKTYNGLAQPLSVIAKTAGLGTITVKYDGGATAPKDAKTYAVTVSIAEGTNYASTTADISLGNYIIDKAALTIIGCTIAVKTYDGTKDASVIGVSFAGVQNGEGFTAVTDYTVTNAQFDSADAGANKTITGTVSLTSTARANNYSLANGSLSVHGQTIGKAAAPAVPNISKNVIYDDTANQTADVAEKVTSYKRTGDTLAYLVGTVGGTNPGIILNPSVNSAGMLTFTCKGGTVGNMATIPVTVSGFGNYNDITVNVSVTLTDKIPVTVNLSVPGKTYDGSAATAAASAPGIPSGDFTYTWMDGNGTALNPNAAPKNAGIYRVKAVISGDSAKTYAGEMIVNFAIDKANIIIRANSKSAYVGDAAPVFGASDYTVVGLAAGETLKTAPTLAYATTPNMRQTGTYAINASGAAVPDGGNYNEIIYVPGTLTISAKSSGGGGGGSGGTSSGGDTTATTPEKKPDQPVTATASITAAAGQNGAASASIPDKTVTDAITKAQTDAKAQGKTVNGIAVALNVTLPQGTTSFTATLSRNSLNSLVSAGVSSLTLAGSPVDVSFDLKALQEIQKQSSGDISITIAPATGLSKEAKALLGNRPVYSITISYVKDGKNFNIPSLGSGTATLSIPYTPGKNEAVGYLFGVYVDAKGKAQRISGSAYDVNSRSLLIPTGHFSVYGVGYTAPIAKFTDIGNHWGKEAIDYVVGRGLLSGTSETTFAPNTAMTRGMLVTALGRLAGVDVKAYSINSFTDVKADSAFCPYIEWAYSKGIVQGTGNGKFEPDRAITREEIAMIFANYAKSTGYKLPVTREATAYADASSIRSVYKTAVTAMQQAGIMMGGTDNRFNPKSNATRAEVSSMLHRYIRLTIDPATAQGWAKNDAGQYLYYNDGKHLTDWQTIDGVKYFFETSGALKTGWVKDGDNWRYYSGNKASLGWLDTSNKRYYFTKDGMVSGKWLELDGKWYYFYADGSLARNTKVDGYEVDKNGVRKTK
ncbi:S-layer homology domain-containing protein [Syntrophomonas zehnderi]|uniref:S-layer homology domain-containing protein n=1 Tax=Syntrophomonas zehnderi TaxID=404335 RepID=UPI0018DB87CE|nr:S-layer homology domain-containing protein [Syntrophomonas zehnderi]